MTQLDVARLADFVGERLGVRRLVVDGFATGGSANVTAFLDADGAQWVLRCPPLTAAAGAHDMLREYRFVHALRGTLVPVPATVVACDNPAVLGAPFYIAERVQGVVMQDGVPDGFADPSQVRRLAESAIDALADLHLVDWAALHLGGRPDGYLARQVQRWSAQAQRLDTASRLGGLPELTAWMGANRPRQSASAIVHGDYGLHNMIVSPPPASRVAAVLDWEMATVGDPMADLAWFVSGWARSRNSEGGIENPGNAVVSWDGAPEAEELLERYAHRTGQPIENWAYYEAFTLWKEAIIAEALYSRYLRGDATNPSVARLATEVPDQVRRLCRAVGVR